MKKSRLPSLGLALVGAGLATAVAVASSYTTSYDPMMTGDNGWSIDAAFTVGETVDGYTPVGVLDGTGALRMSKNTVRVFVNHELGVGAGKSYTLASGATLTGARISYFDFDRKTRDLCGAGEAFDTIFDRNGDEVTSAAQIGGGLNRLCSAKLVEKGTYGFRDDIFFTGEESSNGTLFALDIARGELHACPDVGRGAWEDVTAVDTGCRDTVALLMGDDTAGAPMYLYVGTKGGPSSGFLRRNGLVGGKLYVWVADNGDDSPEDFNGAGASRDGAWVEVPVKDAGNAGNAGYDAAGYLDQGTLYAEASSVGAFMFSRPEDLHTNPADGQQVVFASTGRGQLFPSDNWGTIYVIELDFGRRCRRSCHQGEMGATFTILHDADGLATPDAGIRSPDNVVWAEDGYIYAQEDRSTSPGSLFGGTTGREASIWQLNPNTGAWQGIAEMDRTAVAPTGSTDPVPGDIGNWESSGVIDVSDLYQTRPSETLLLAVVQAHSVRDGAIGGGSNLVEGGQIIFLSKEMSARGHCRGRWRR
ncbi:MAG: DUF839 domain-containing protein [Planctomycetota bacterium]